MTSAVWGEVMSEVSTTIQSRIETANAVLRLLAPGTSITNERGWLTVHWTYLGKPISRRWMTRGQDFYPVWNRRWGHGGTCATALSSLIRWCQGKTPLPLSTWRYWTGQTVRLGRQDGPEILRLLSDGGYPETVPCCLCGRQLNGSLDWWSLKNVRGPCCSSYDPNGCRQKVGVAT